MDIPTGEEGRKAAGIDIYAKHEGQRGRNSAHVDSDRGLHHPASTDLPK